MTMSEQMIRQTFFLTNRDLPSKHASHLTELTEPELQEHFEELEMYKIQGRMENGYLTRIFITLPLRISGLAAEDSEIRFIPIPFIVDTGAPVTLILGRGAEYLLKDKKVLKSGYKRELGDHYYLKGNLLYKDEQGMLNPMVHSRTTNMENDKTFNELQANLLGLKALGELGINICLSEIRDECIREWQETATANL